MFRPALRSSNGEGSPLLTLTTFDRLGLGAEWSTTDPKPTPRHIEQELWQSDPPVPPSRPREPLLADVDDRRARPRRATDASDFGKATRCRPIGGYKAAVQLVPATGAAMTRRRSAETRSTSGQPNAQRSAGAPSRYRRRPPRTVRTGGRGPRSDRQRLSHHRVVSPAAVMCDGCFGPLSACSFATWRGPPQTR